MPKRQIKKPTMQELSKMSEGGKRPAPGDKPRKKSVGSTGLARRAAGLLNTRQKRLDRILESGHETAKDERSMP